MTIMIRDSRMFKLNLKNMKEVLKQKADCMSMTLTYIIHLQTTSNLIKTQSLAAQED